VPFNEKVILVIYGINLDKRPQSLLFLDLHAFAVQYIFAVNPLKIAFLKKEARG